VSADIETLHAAYSQAFVAYTRRKNDVDSAATKAAIAARSEVQNAHRDELDALSKDAMLKKAAYDQAVSNAASHPWEGKRVFKDENTGKSWRPATKRIFGIVRVRRNGERPGAANQNYGLPRIGQAYIVAVKKDGTEAVRVLERAGDGGAFWKWQLDEVRP
jgi:hypothetical protein